jgi:hypothetical protein
MPRKQTQLPGVKEARALDAGIAKTILENAQASASAVRADAIGAYENTESMKDFDAIAAAWAKQVTDGYPAKSRAARTSEWKRFYAACAFGMPEAIKACGDSLTSRVQLFKLARIVWTNKSSRGAKTALNADKKNKAKALQFADLTFAQQADRLHKRFSQMKAPSNSKAQQELHAAIVLAFSRYDEATKQGK